MLKDLATILSSALQDEATFVAANSLYCELFRDAKSFRLADEPSMREELISYLRSDVYAPTPQQEFVFTDNSSVDEEFEDYEDDNDFYDDPEPEVIKQGLSLEVAEAIVDELDFVWTCNYKGEGGDFELLARVKHLRVFHGKHNYS